MFTTSSASHMFFVFLPCLPQEVPIALQMAKKKTNTRSKGGGEGGGGIKGRNKTNSWNCTKLSSEGMGLKKTLSICSVKKSKSRQYGQNSKHISFEGTKVLEPQVTTINEEPVKKGQRGKKLLSAFTKEVETCSSGHDNKEMKYTTAVSQEMNTNGSTCEKKICSETYTERPHLQSTSLLNGSQIEDSPKKMTDDFKPINGDFTSNVSSDTNANLVCNSELQKKDSPEGPRNGDNVKINDIAHNLDISRKNDSLTGTECNTELEISRHSHSESEIKDKDDLSKTESSLQNKQENSNSIPSETSDKTKYSENGNKSILSSKSPKSSLASIPEASVRKSGRKSVPNRKYQDMETNFSRKKSRTASSPEKKSGKSFEQLQASKSQNSSASTLKRKTDLITDKNPASKKQAIEELSGNEIGQEGSPSKLVKLHLKKNPTISTQPIVFTSATSFLNEQPTSLISNEKIAPHIVKIANSQKSSANFEKPVQLSSVSQLVKKTVELTVNNPNSNSQTQAVTLVERNQPAASTTMLTANHKNSHSVSNKSALNEENLPALQTTNVGGHTTQGLPTNISSEEKTLENVGTFLPKVSDSVCPSSNSVSTNNNKSERIVVVHSEPVFTRKNQEIDFLVAEKNLSKESTESSASIDGISSVPHIVVTIPNTISSIPLQNSSLSSTSDIATESGMTYAMEMDVPSTKPIISFTEGMPQPSPYMVSLLNNNNNSGSSNKDKEAVESLINATHIAEKDNEGSSVMMCLSSGTEELVPSNMSLDVNSHHDAHRLETEAAIQEITASFPQSFTDNDIVIHEKDQITKSSISLAEAAKMVAESQTIVDLPDVNSLSECGLEELHNQPTAISHVASTTLPTAVASTQTPLQLPRKNLKTASLLKSITGNMQHSGKLPLDMDDEDDNEDDDCFENDDEEEEEEEEVEIKQVEPRKSTQEFIVVHLPEGAQIKRERVGSRHQMEPLGRGRVDENGSYRCNECSYVTVKKANWYKHRKKHLGLRPHSCIKCNYKATTSSNLKRHMAIHADLREYKCNLCSNYFRQKIHLERHMKYKHEEKKVQCPLCNYVCASENPDLKIHFKRRHVPSTYDTMASFTCDECGLVTVSKKDLKQHAKFHRKGPELKLFCEQCSFVTDCESRLRRHVITHTKVKPFKCGLCDYRGSQKEHVLRHMKSRHSIEIQRNPRRPRDDECNSDSMDRDRTDFTTRDKIFACNHCTMKFSKLINLYKHLHTQHKNIMPIGEQNDFYCVVCDFKTTSKKNLLVHMRKHNMQEQNPPSHVYSCVLCRYVHPKRRNLFQHMMKKHGIEIVMNMKDDWSSYGYTNNSAPPVLLDKGDGTEPNIMTVGNVVTATSDESNQLMVVTEDADSNTMQTVITIEDLASSMTNPVKMSEVSSVGSVTGEPSDKILPDELNQQQHAADAVEGLQALAEHLRVVDNDAHFKCENDIENKIEDAGDEAISSLRMNNNEKNNIADKNLSEIDEATVSVIDQMTTEAPIKESFELTTDQVVHLSTGDYVEINGEVYKVEISTEPAEETVTTTSSTDSANMESNETNESNADSFLT